MLSISREEERGGEEERGEGAPTSDIYSSLLDVTEDFEYMIRKGSLSGGCVSVYQEVKSQSPHMDNMEAQGREY